MATLYKITTIDDETHGGTTWAASTTHSGTGDATKDLCSVAWIHAYESEALAHFMNPIHLGLISYNVWSSTGTIAKKKQQTKVGCASLTTNTKLVSLALPSLVNRIAFGILAVRAVLQNENWGAWEVGWIDNLNRTTSSAASVGNFIQGLATDATVRAAVSGKNAARAATEAADATADTSAQTEARLAVFASEQAQQLAQLGSVAPANRKIAEAQLHVVVSAAASVAAASDQRQALIAAVAQRAAQAAVMAAGTASALSAATLACTAAALTDPDDIAVNAAKAAALAGETADTLGVVLDFIAIAAEAMLVL